MVKAQIFEIKISASALDWAHGYIQTIDEIYIPELDICYNVTGNEERPELHVFKLNGSKRYTKETSKLISEFELSDITARFLKDYLIHYDYLVRKFDELSL